MRGITALLSAYFVITVLGNAPQVVVFG